MLSLSNVQVRDTEPAFPIAVTVRVCVCLFDCLHFLSFYTSVSPASEPHLLNSVKDCSLFSICLHSSPLLSTHLLIFNLIHSASLIALFFFFLPSPPRLLQLPFPFTSYPLLLLHPLSFLSEMSLCCLCD